MYTCARYVFFMTFFVCGMCIGMDISVGLSQNFQHVYVALTIPPRRNGPWSTMNYHGHTTMNYHGHVSLNGTPWSLTMVDHGHHRGAMVIDGRPW